MFATGFEFVGAASFTFGFVACAEGAVSGFDPCGAPVEFDPVVALAGGFEGFATPDTGAAVGVVWAGTSDGAVTG